VLVFLSIYDISSAGEVTQYSVTAQLTRITEKMCKQAVVTNGTDTNPVYAWSTTYNFTQEPRIELGVLRTQSKRVHH
jgi:hypothetical protein